MLQEALSWLPHADRSRAKEVPLFRLATVHASLLQQQPGGGLVVRAVLRSVGEEVLFVDDLMSAGLQHAQACLLVDGQWPQQEEGACQRLLPAHLMGEPLLLPVLLPPSSPGPVGGAHRHVARPCLVDRGAGFWLCHEQGLPFYSHTTLSLTPPPPKATSQQQQQPAERLEVYRGPSTITNDSSSNGGSGSAVVEVAGPLQGSSSRGQAVTA